MARRCALVLALLLASPVAAHQGDPNVFTRIDSVTPELPGVVVQIRAGVADQLFVANSTDTPVEVIDSSGKPFLRIGPDRVEANYTSSDWYTSNSPLGLAQTPPPDTSLIPWRMVGRGNSWGWFDHRLHDGPAVPPPGARSVTRLNDWTIPMRHGKTDVLVKGHVEYRPVLGTFHTQVGSVPPGVAVDTLDGRVPGLFVRWQGTGTLTVDGIDGRPFARFTSKGVEVNDASETWQEDQRLRNERSVNTPPADDDWTLRATEPRLTWLDRRLAYTPGVPPDDALRSTRPTTVVEWDIPVDVNGTAGHVQGTTTWVPNAARTTGDDGRPWLPVALLAVVVVVAAVALRRRAER